MERDRRPSTDMVDAALRYRQAPSVNRRSGEEEEPKDLLDTIRERVGCFPLLILGVVAFIGFKFYPQELMSFGKLLVLVSVALLGGSVLLYPLLLLITSAQRSLGKPNIEVSMITSMRLVVAIPITIAIGAFSLLLFFPLETLVFLIAFPFVALIAERETAKKFQAGYPLTIRWLPEFVKDVRNWVVAD